MSSGYRVGEFRIWGGWLGVIARRWDPKPTAGPSTALRSAQDDKIFHAGGQRYVREDSVYVREDSVYVREDSVYVQEDSVYVQDDNVYVMLRSGY
ncbi:MAG TPA: hypothetical protein VH250_03675 [Granulicella sp.]|nr:hypothetical protein [Granulicella sp.]